MNYSLAPMEGLTGYVYRQAHRRFYPGLSRYYTPFLSPVRDRALTTRDRNEVLPEHNAGVPLTPQLLTRSLPNLLWGARLLGEMGYDEVNLNLGCPSPTVTAKGKGAGFLREPDAIAALLDGFFSADTGMRLSVKTRLGVENPEDFECLLEVYNRFPLSELIVHPRVQTDLYKRPTRPEYALRALRESRAPVCSITAICSPARRSARCLPASRASSAPCWAADCWPVPRWRQANRMWRACARISRRAARRLPAAALRRPERALPLQGAVVLSALFLCRAGKVLQAHQKVRHAQGIPRRGRRAL